MDEMLHMVLKVNSTTWKLYAGECVTVRNKLMMQKASSVIAEFLLKCNSRKKKKKKAPGITRGITRQGFEMGTHSNSA